MVSRRIPRKTPSAFAANSALDDPKDYVASNAYGLTNVPSIFYIGQDGTIEVSSVGWSKHDIEQIGRRLGTVQHVPVTAIFKPGEQVTDFRGG